MSQAKDHIEQRLRPGMSRRKVVSEIQGVLIDLHATHINPRQHFDPEYSLDLLVAIRTPGGISFHVSSRTVLAPALNERACIGWDPGLGLYLAHSLFQSGMSLKWGRIVAAYLIAQAKEYSGQCGGDTNILEIPLVGDHGFVSQAEIAAAEQYLAEIDKAMRLVLPDASVSEDTVAHRMHLLHEAILRARSALMASPGAGPLALQGLPSEVVVEPVPAPEDSKE